ncbi:hypothetical protein K1719_023052 [Acacia pycnantha]|nr:hypothetical protein K1719_023052 [Acacia pycnantha]
MANQRYLYAYSPTYGGASPPSAAATTASTLSSSRYLSSDMYFPQRKDSILRYSSYATSDADIGPPGVSTRLSSAASGHTPSTATQLLSHASWPAAIASANVGSAALDSIINLKRSSDALYHPTFLQTHNTIGQSEAWYSSNSLTKRPRYESTSHLPIYPQRPGEKDCAHYMLTRTCKFGDACIFDHPIWVPEGGIPDWKEVPNVATSETLPERPGESDCPYFLKTKRCKFGLRCKFNHPMHLIENADVSTLPERPSEPPCAFYMKTGKCKFGITCKFHHPKDIQIQLSEEQNGAVEQTHLTPHIKGALGDAQLSNPFSSYTGPVWQNTKGLPIRLGEVDCPFYMKTGSCKYGATCRYNHPDRNVINPPATGLGHSVLTSAAANLNFGIVNPAASIYQAIDPRLSSATSQVGKAPTFYPQRPGQIECDYYMKTGECKFGELCKFHHPIDRSAPSQSNSAAQQAVKLTPAGLPRREGSVICPYYLKTGTCKFGATCKFDHPSPGEVMEMAKSQGGYEVGEEAEADEKQADFVQEKK